MGSRLAKWKARNFLVAVLFLQFVVYAIVFFDVPVVRQVFGFLYFTLVPGFVIITLLKFDELDRVEAILFAVGFSIAFLMITGLFINEICFLLGISQPLSLIPLMIILNSLLLLLGVLVYPKCETVKLSGDSPGISPSALLFICLPILSIVGATWVKIYENNLILLFMIIAISSLFATGVISKKFLPPRLYPLAVLAIAISLLYHSSLISDHLIHFGSDVPGEVFAFKIVEKNGHWASINPVLGDSSVGRTYAMLSVTILPLIYSRLLNLNSILVFKTIYPIVFSMVALGLYKIWSKFMNDKYALISAFFYMSYQIFYTEMLGLNKQMIGELFFILLLLVILNKKMKPINRTVYFLIFGFSLVVSHYALSEIFLFLISFALITLIIMKRTRAPSRNITLSIVFLFFVIMFSWYIFTSSSSVFNSFSSFGEHVYNQLNEFFSPESRGETVLRGLGMEAPPSIWNIISRAFAYVTQALIIVGFVGLVIKRKEIHLEMEYFVLILLTMILLVALLLVPGLANTLNMNRFYHILLFFLAPLCVLGADTIVNLISKRKVEVKVSILLLTVLVPYFLFQTGFVYELTRNESWSISLSKYRMGSVRPYLEFGVIDEYSILGAEWLSRNVAVGHSQVYSDDFSRRNELRAYGGVYAGYVEILSNVTQVKAGGVVYLNPSNTIGGIMWGSGYLWNTSEFHFLSDLSKIYSNGESEVYKAPQ